ncbi:MAG: acyl carrier protein [Planctomycetota bacterium]
MTSDGKAPATGDPSERIRSFVRSRFPLARGMALEDDESLLESGVIDSLGILDLVGYLERTFGVRVQDEELNPGNFDSIGALVRFVEEKRG